MNRIKQRWLAALLALCLLLSLTAPAAAAQPDSETENTETALPVEETAEEEAPEELPEEEPAEEPAAEEVVSDIPSAFAATEVTAPRQTNCDVAAIHYTDASGEEQNILFSETAAGYVYTLPTGVSADAVTVEYFSTVKWDGAVDISWYDADKKEFTLTTPAQLAGLAALVNGRTSAETSRWRVKGDTTLLVSVRKDNVTLVGEGAGNVAGSVYYASAQYDFSDKTVYLGCDMDMGGTANWTPIGGKYPMDPGSTNDPVTIEAFFNGTLDGRGHRITNLYCDRYSVKHFAYSQAIGLVGYLGELYAGESAPAQAPTVRNLSVDGSIYGRRMVGGIVGWVGSIGTGARIENCANYATVRSHDAKGCGGIVGAGWGTGYIINCYNIGDVSNRDYQCPTGGICANNNGLNIYACYNVGQIFGADGRGRGIGGHNSGSYTVDNCYMLEGCDNDPSSNGWYISPGASCTVKIGVWSEAQMRSQALVDALNASGSAYVYNADGYPKLFWEDGWPAGVCQVTAQSGDSVAVTATPSGSVARGTVVYLSHTMAAGSVFRGYTANGEALRSDYYTALTDVTLGAAAEGMTPGTIQLQDSSVYTLTVTKTGTVYVDGQATKVTDHPIAHGDPIYEGDVLTVKATVNDGAYPADTDLIYSGKFTYTFRYDDGADAGSSNEKGAFTVTGNQAPLIVTAVPQTAKKLWTQVADTAWYSAGKTSFTLTTARQLAGLAQLVNSRTDDFSGKTIRLGNDISLRNDDGTHGTRLWVGIGTSGSFNGTFDGGGYAISQMTAASGGSTGGSAALFITCSGATIKDLSLFGSATGGSAAGLVLNMTNTTIENCTVSVTVTASGSGYSGGVAGMMSGGTMKSCVNRGPVTGQNGTGALAGKLTGSGVMEDCVNYGTVSGNNDNRGLGGLAGDCDGGKLLRCANYGAVNGTSQYTGGLIGNCISGTITDCYNAADITGGCEKASSSYVGGLVGQAKLYTLANCFNVGTAAVDSGLNGTVGSVFGFDNMASTSRGTNIWYLEAAGQPAVGGTKTGSANPKSQITACTAEQLKNGTVWKALNVNGCFVMGERDYPELSTIPAAYTIRGQVDAGGRSVTVTLLENGQTVQQLTGITGEFQFFPRANGSYSLLLEAEGCVSRQIVIPQNFTGVLDTVTLRQAGDVNGDGALDVYDIQRLYEHVSGIAPLTEDYALLLADVNQDGLRNAQDIQRLYEQLTGTA